MRVLKTLSRWRGSGVAAVLLGALLLAVLTAENPLSADAEAKKAALPADLAKIPSDGALVLSIRIAELWKSDLLKSVRGKSKEIDQAAKEFEKSFGLSLEQVERLSLVIAGSPRREAAIVVRTVKPYERAKVLAADKNYEEQQYKGKALYVSETWNVYLLDDRSLVYSEFLSDLRALIDHPKPKAKGALADALERAAEKHALVLGVNVKQYYDRSEGNPLPPEAEPLRPLFVAQRLTLIADLGAESRLSLALHFANENDAKAAIKTAHTGLDLARATVDDGIKTLAKDKERADLVALLKEFLAPLQTAKIERQGATLQASVRSRIERVAGGVALAALQRARESTDRTVGQLQLRQIALVMSKYAGSNGGRFPPQAIYNKDGKPLLSWRVMILPYIFEEDLYKQFHLNEPWDSEHNKKLLAKMPSFYAAPQDEKTLKEHTTYYQCFAGKGAFFAGKQGLRVPADFPDGMSNTIMIAEASKAVPWTKPEDIAYDPDKPLPKLGLPGVRGFSAVMGDGSVHWFPPTITQKTLRLAITRNDGQPLGSDF